MSKLLKIILMGLSLYITYLNFNLGNSNVAIYWIVVFMYWTFNLISEIKGK